jgi:hypothetical protein
MPSTIVSKDEERVQAAIRPLVGLISSQVFQGKRGGWNFRESQAKPKRLTQARVIIELSWTELDDLSLSEFALEARITNALKIAYGDAPLGFTAVILEITTTGAQGYLGITRY